MRFAERNHSFFSWQFRHCSQKMQRMRIVAENRSVTPASRQLSAIQIGAIAERNLGAQSPDGEAEGAF
jgi:hypothetical protein